ncbi:hypothetical protein BKA80DRAFT_264061 [Phyllosticta citrichinensis]
MMLRKRIRERVRAQVGNRLAPCPFIAFVSSDVRWRYGSARKRGRVYGGGWLVGVGEPPLDGI